MANINLSQNNYTDYVASLYFKACNVSDVKFSTKTVEVGDDQVPLVHIEGVQLSSGVVVNVDLWPRNHATEENIKDMPTKLDDIVFRVGYHAEIDENGEKTFREGAPKWIAYVKDGKTVTLSGEKREFGE